MGARDFSGTSIGSIFFLFLCRQFALETSLTMVFAQVAVFTNTMSVFGSINMRASRCQFLSAPSMITVLAHPFGVKDSIDVRTLSNFTSRDLLNGLLGLLWLAWLARLSSTWCISNTTRPSFITDCRWEWHSEPITAHVDALVLFHVAEPSVFYRVVIN